EYCEKVYRDALYDSYKEYVDDIIDDGFWYFDNEGITFFADEYVLAPYASGMLEFPIPYSSLAPYINEKYLPAKVDVNTYVSAKEPELGPKGSREAIDYVAVYTEGEEFCFLPQDTVTNVKLYATTYYVGEETISVFNDYVLWACSDMNEKQALDIVNMFPDVVPNIGISCTLADGCAFSKLLYQSGEDGSILFSDYR
ncbi:MAG: DUF3298 domain-containing protein, partial [Oscillospiraceae bacterium]|nr:DUF3298 domain-containing protein [Oscillospiraceae bacterium]